MPVSLSHRSTQQSPDETEEQIVFCILAEAASALYLAFDSSVN